MVCGLMCRYCGVSRCTCVCAIPSAVSCDMSMVPWYTGGGGGGYYHNTEDRALNRVLYQYLTMVDISVYIVVSRDLLWKWNIICNTCMYD